MRIYSYNTNPPGKKTRSKKFKLNLKFFKNWNWKKISTFSFRFFAGVILLIAIMFVYYTRDLPDPNKLLDRQVPESTKIFARDGSLLYEIHGEYKRTQVTLDQINDNLKHATIAVEDKDFYKHSGISFTGIARAALTDILTGKKSQGGSTITQQFVKNAILTKDKSWDRKIREAMLSMAIEAKFSKDQILTFYLNEIPYGENAYGVEAAAQTYFNKSAKDLDLAESAYLAAMPQAPTYYNPDGPHRDALDNRKNTILSLMEQQGYINQDQEKSAKSEKVIFATITSGIKAPHFVLMVKDYLAQKYGETTLEQGGLKVYTTLDPRLQDIAEQVVKADVAKESKKYNANNAALVAIDPKTGQILAMVGSKDYFGTPEPAGCTPGKNCTFEPNVNVALSQRQPGSSFKPYVYVTAFKKDFGYAPASLLMDVPTNFGTYNGKDYVPGNYNGSNYGPVSMRKALAGSLNVPAVKTLALVGVDNAVQTAHDLGITSPLNDCGLSLVLGGCEVRLLDHVAAYSVFANEGVKHEKTAILKVEDKNGKTLEEFKDSPQNVLDPEATYELISVMTDNNARSFIFGSNSPLILPDRVVAAKTGTTNKWHDGWTIGFTPSLVAGVWSGNNDGTLLKQGADGVVVAAPIWHDFMVQALKNTPAETFTVPNGIKQIPVDQVSGKLPTQFSPATITETFADYSVPTDYDNVHIQVAIDSTTGQPANSLTPPAQITYQNYTVFHSEKPDNPNWEQPVVAWALANNYSYPPGTAIVNNLPTGSSANGPDLNIVEPADGATISHLPFSVSVSAVSANPVARIDLSIDGQLIQSITSSPYLFQVDQVLSDGSHTVAIKGVDSLGNTSDTSETITYALNSPLTITAPDANSSVSFPLTLTAESANSYGNVTFYYTDSQGQTKTIGQADNISKPADNLVYSLTWTGPLPSGKYKIFAKAEGSINSPQIKIIVP